MVMQALVQWQTKIDMLSRNSNAIMLKSSIRDYQCRHTNNKQACSHAERSPNHKTFGRLRASPTALVALRKVFRLASLTISHSSLNTSNIDRHRKIGSHHTIGSRPTLQCHDSSNNHNITCTIQ